MVRWCPSFATQYLWPPETVQQTKARELVQQLGTLHRYKARVVLLGSKNSIVTSKHAKIRIFRQSSKQKNTNPSESKYTYYTSTTTLHTTNPITRMTSVEFEEPTDACSFVSVMRPDGSVYRFKSHDCGSKTCRYSASYVPPRA